MSSSFSWEKSDDFWAAAEDGNLPLVESLLVDPEVDLNLRGGGGKTPFFCACSFGQVDVVRYLLDFHDNHPREPIDYNLVSNSTYTPFFTACVNGREKVVEMLLEDDRIDVKRASKDGATPLWWATYEGHVGVVKRLLASTRELNVLKKDSWKKKTAAEIPREHRNHYVAALLEAYQRDPQGVRKQLRRELGLDGNRSQEILLLLISRSKLPCFNRPPRWELFALAVYLSDGYLSIRPEHQGQREQRFLSIADQLPMELQMVLCNRVFGVPDSIVKKIDSERGFRKFAKGF